MHERSQLFCANCVGRQTLACSIAIFAIAIFAIAISVSNPVLSEELQDSSENLTLPQAAIQELQLLRQQDGSRFRRHLQVCSLTERISRLCLDAGVAMGGYSLTKSQQFSDRFDKTISELSNKMKELKEIVSTTPKEETTAQLIGTDAEGLLAILREARGLVDDQQVSEAQFRTHHVYKDVRGATDQIAEDTKNLREEDLALVNESIKTAPKPQKPNSAEKTEFFHKQQGTIQELQRLRQQDAAYFDKHLQVRSVTERISRLCYDAGVALAGYSITKSQKFSDRFDKMNSDLPDMVKELRDVVCTIPKEETTAQLISRHAEAVFASYREAASAIDHKPTSDALHASKDAEEAAGLLEQDIQNLRDEDLARLTESLKTAPDPAAPANPTDTTRNINPSPTRILRVPE